MFKMAMAVFIFMSFILTGYSAQARYVKHHQRRYRVVRLHATTIHLAHFSPRYHKARRRGAFQKAGYVKRNGSVRYEVATYYRNVKKSKNRVAQRYL